MSLFTKALIFGAGYALGHPQGRRQLVQAREQASRLAQNPRVVRAREHAWDVAGDQALAVKNRVAGAKFRRSADSGASSVGSAGSRPQHAQSSVPPRPDSTDTAVATAAAGTAAAADGVRVSPAPDQPTPPIPPADRP
jgi:hypothetical protein